MSSKKDNDSESLECNESYALESIHSTDSESDAEPIQLSMVDSKRKCYDDMNPGPSKLRRHSPANFRPLLELDANKSQLLRAWSRNEGHSVDGVEFMMDPFKVYHIKNFFDEEEFVEDLTDELCSLKFINKNNDLFKFRQSVDLSNIDSPSVNLLKTFLAGKCRSWLQDITGLELIEKIAMTCSVYNYTDYLLCHDDMCEDRCIAFILYLNRDWLEADGGALQLFNTDDTLQPKDVVTSILPKFNSFIFFEVSKKSFHQVSEIFTNERTRMTVNGWFHGPLQLLPTTFVQPIVPRYGPENNADMEEFTQFLNPVYMNRLYQKEISKIIELESEISLEDFIKDEFFLEICESFKNENIIWEKRGPPNRRSYMVALEDSLSSIVKKFLRFLKSNLMFELLKKLTKLDLVKSTDEGKEAGKCSANSEKGPQCSYEVQKWESGCYTLVNDDDETFKECGLDVTFYFNVGDIKNCHGGFTSYIARDLDEELLTVKPKQNAMALTFRDKETLSFVKYINHCLVDSFQTISLTYRE